MSDGTRRTPTNRDGATDGIARLTAKLLLKPEDAAELLSYSRDRVYQLIAAGELESVKEGRLRRIPRIALDEYVDRLRRSQTAA